MNVEAITATLEALRVGEEMPMTNAALAAYRERIAAVLLEQFGEWEQVTDECVERGTQAPILDDVFRWKRTDGPDWTRTEVVRGIFDSVFVRAGRYGEGE